MRRRPRGPSGPLPDPNAYHPPEPPPRPVWSDDLRAAPVRIGEPLLALLQAVQASVPARGVLAPVDENYWRDLLLDPRGRTPSDETSFPDDSYFAYARLDRLPGKMVTVRCHCGERQAFDRRELIEKFGAAANIVWLARKIVDCGNRDKVANHCRAYVWR
jgi:hypothetical protein